MASPEDGGAKKELFYEIECVIDDCDGDGELGYKPLSDSDELEAEEEGPREEDIDSSEEWQPLMGRSKARRQQHAILSASPRRRGRPPKHASKLFLNPPTLASGTAIFPKGIPNAPSLPRQRGRPPKNKSKTIPRPTTYPTLIPKPIPYFTPIYSSTPIFIHNPTTGINLSPNSTPIPTTDLTPSIKLSPDSTPTTNTAPIATLICKPTPTGLLLDADTNEISNLWKERGPLEEGVSAIEGWAAPMKQSPERLKSPAPTEAKKQRLSSPPAATPTRRRGRPRKHTSNPETNSNPNPNPTTTSNLNPIPTININSNPKPVITFKPNHNPTTTTNLHPNPTTMTNLNPNPTTTTNSNSIPTINSDSNCNPAAIFNPNHNPTTNNNLNPNPETTFNPNPNPTTTFNFNPSPTITTNPNPESSFAVPLEDSDSNSDLSGKDEELWEEDVDSGEDWESVMEQSPVCMKSPVSASTLPSLWDGLFKQATKPSSLQLRGGPTKSTSEPVPNLTTEATSNPTPDPTTIPSPSLTSTSIPTPEPILISISKPMPNPTPELEPILNTTLIPTPNGTMTSTSKTTLEPTSNPIITAKSKPRHKPNPTSEAIPIRKNSKSTPTYSQREARSESTFDSYWVKGGIACEPDKWFDVTIEDRKRVLPRFCPKQPPGPQLVLERDYTPLQLFQLFFTSSVIETIVRNTNCYAEKRAKAGKKFLWVPLTVKEFHSYVALVVYMGLVKAKSLLDYWARKMMYNFSYPQSVMSRTRFQAISWNLYLCDLQEDEENNKKKGTPGYDRLLKIKPLYTEIISACMTHFHPNREITIDERMDATKAKIGLRILEDKPAEWGYKLFVLADCSSGYTWNFFVYEGKIYTSTDKGVGYDAVMRLLDHELLGTGYRLYTDSFYTSPTLFLDLWQNNILACGTLCDTSSLPEVSDLSRRAEKGSIRWYRQGPLLFLKWTDMKEVIMCSTMHKAYVGDTISRNVRGDGGVCSERQIPIPPAVKDYNKYMGDLDLSDALIEYYSVIHKTKQWYKSFFFHFLEIAVENSYILHQQMAKAQKETPLSQKAFRETLVSELECVGKGKKPSTSASQDPTSVPTAPDSSDTESSLPASPFSFTWTEQCFPEYFGTDVTYGMKNCVLCRLSQHKVKTSIFCTHCKVPLCFESSRNCFKKWHIKGHAKKL
ncbi:uncharacterized protein LOC127409604 isoform X1 [Myxocyprinus asiaticus]|uniref:uncharacterized protein LOC127409604 isoform X1 n=1 Tax=Myxocyprinus asiaticus TaxID=70543 RepID=UPI00222304D6|nr:uncharacterized protein LOC127409604 isoform X1 [Myxocyprinus asiaticus]